MHTHFPKRGIFEIKIKNKFKTLKYAKVKRTFDWKLFS